MGVSFSRKERAFIGGKSRPCLWRPVSFSDVKWKTQKYYPAQKWQQNTFFVSILVLLTLLLSEWSKFHRVLAVL